MSPSESIRTGARILLYLTLLQMLHAFEIENNNRLKITSQHGYELTQTVNVQRQENLQKMCETFGGMGQRREGGFLKPPPSASSTMSLDEKKKEIVEGDESVDRVKVEDEEKVDRDGIHQDEVAGKERTGNSIEEEGQQQKIVEEEENEEGSPTAGDSKQLLNVDELSQVQMEHLLVDKQHKLLYCYVPKVACTNWKRILMMLTNQWNGTDPLLIPATLAHSPNMFVKLSDLPLEEKQQVLADYTKFIVVRHPFERLLSAYRNKLESDQASALYFHQRIGRQIIRSFRPNASNESLALGNDVTFTEFVQYLLTPEMSTNYQSNQSYNEHWEPIASLCNPCLVKYNVIGKYETLIDDSGLVLKTVGVDWVTFPAGQRTSGTADKLRRYFDNLPIAMIRSLYKVYERDFKLFGYNLDEVLGFELG